MMVINRHQRWDPYMSPSSDRSYIWVFHTAAGFLAAGVILRSVLVIENGTVLLEALLLLTGWLVLFAGEPLISKRWRAWPIPYMVLQTSIVIALFLLPGDEDFFAVLFAALSMQALRRFGRPGALWPAAFVPLMLVAFLADYELPQALTLTLVYTAVNVILGLYALATRRAEQARHRNWALGRELEVANARLTEYLDRVESLVVAEERNRVARELHDSVTQTIFSMTLASQSAAILLRREPSKADEQLERLRRLAERALAEMRLLVSQLEPDAVEGESLVEAIGRDVDRRRSDGVSVSFDVRQEPLDADAKPLSAAEEAALAGIAREALNNVVKHAGTSQATILLRLGGRPGLEIRDRGRGFDPQNSRDGSGMGLVSMKERAAEVGWVVEVESAPGRGTRVVVRRVAGQGGGI
jgi:signal transduction histidine kinase